MLPHALDERPLPPQIARQSTILASWVTLAYRLLDYRGYDSKQIFRNAGIGREQLRDPGARLPHKLINERIWTAGSEQILDRDIALDAAQVIWPGMFHSLSMAMFAAPDIYTVLSHLARYRRIFHPLSRMRLQETSEGYAFHWGPLTPYVTSISSEAVIAALMGLCRELTHPNFAPKVVHLKCGLTKTEQTRYENFFNTSVLGNKEDNILLFDRHAVSEPLLTANGKMERLCIQATRDYIAGLDQVEISNTVYCKIAEALPSQSHAEEMIASDLHMSLRTMQRRLHDAGTSYDQLLQETRKELALDYLRDEQLSIQEVSHLVGFSEPTNFSRAFKRWTGESPSTYRG